MYSPVRAALYMFSLSGGLVPRLYKCKLSLKYHMSYTGHVFIEAIEHCLKLNFHYPVASCGQVAFSGGPLLL